MPRQQQQATVARRPLLLRPAYFAVDVTRAVFGLWLTLALTVLYLPIALVSRVTGRSDRDLVGMIPVLGSRLNARNGNQLSYSDRLRLAASNALHLGSVTDFESLSSELKRKTDLITRLEQELDKIKLNEAILADNLALRDIAHELKPDLRDEYEVEQKLLLLLKNRVQDTKLADEYREAAERQSQQYSQVVDELRQELMKELSVIEHQQEDKAALEKQIQVARGIIQKLQDNLAEEESLRNQQLEDQKKKYKEEQDRVSAEFKTATDFCRDLRRKLDSETKHKDSLLGKYQQLASELKEYKKREEEQGARLRELDSQIKEEQHQLALTKQERQKDVESNKTTIASLQTELKVVNDRIVIVQDKASEQKAKQLEQAAKDKQSLIEKYEGELKRLHSEADAERQRASKEHSLQLQMIEDLKVKDTDDVQRERTKAAGDIKKLQAQHEHEMQRLEAKLNKSREELEASAALLNLIKSQYEEEKNKGLKLADEIHKLEEELGLARSDRDKLQSRIEQHSKELELERQSLSTKLELEKNGLRQDFEAEKAKLVSAYRQQISDLERELEEQKVSTSESERSLEELKSQLVGRIAQLEKDRLEANNRVKEAEKLAKTKETTLRETLKLQEASSQRASRLASSLAEEQKKTSTLQKKLEEEIQNTQTTHAARLEYIRKLEAQVTTAKDLIATLKPQYDGEREKNQQLLSEWRSEKGKMDSQVEQLNRTLAAEREIASHEKSKVAKFETQLRQLGNRNDALQRDVQNSADGKELRVNKEIHTTEVRTVETH